MSGRRRRCKVDPWTPVAPGRYTGLVAAGELIGPRDSGLAISGVVVEDSQIRMRLVRCRLTECQLISIDRQSSLMIRYCHFVRCTVSGPLGELSIMSIPEWDDGPRWAPYDDWAIDFRDAEITYSFSVNNIPVERLLHADRNGVVVRPPARLEDLGPVLEPRDQLIRGPLAEAIASGSPTSLLLLSDYHVEMGVIDWLRGKGLAAE